jgi:hypothetical protein
MDIFRRWIRREHSIWKIAREAGLSFRSRRRPLLIAGIAAAALVVLLLAAWLSPWPRILADARVRILATSSAGAQAGEGAAGAPAASALVERVVFKADRGPFDLSIDGQQPLTSRGQKDAERIVVQSIAPGRHSIVATPVPGAPVTRDVEITATGQIVELVFGPRPAPAAAAGAAETTVPAETSGTAAPAEAVATAPAEEKPSPATQAVETVKPSMVVISTRPSEARVLIDGNDTGRKTPFTESMEPGTYQVAVEREGYRSVSTTITVAPDKPQQLEITLEEAWGQLSLDVRPTAKIYLDGAFLVETPYAKPVKVRAGNHTLRIENEDLKVNKEIQIQVAEGETRQVQEVLKEAKP